MSLLFSRDSSRSWAHSLRVTATTQHPHKTGGSETRVLS